MDCPGPTRPLEFIVMRSPVRLVSLFTLAALACTVQASTSSSNPNDTAVADPAAGKPVEQAEPATKPIEEPKPDPKAEAKKQYEAAMAELEAQFKAEQARWTPEMTAGVEKLSATKWRGVEQAMNTILKSPHRKPGNPERDQYRHPAKTLGFFGVKPTMHVYEVGPGGGWWTELLAPMLAAKGQLAVGMMDKNSDDDQVKYYARATEVLLDAAPALYGKVERIPTAPGAYDMGPAGSLDMILVMRMTHNLVRSGKFDVFLTKANETLKPGGILAIEQHRAPEGADPMQSAEKGYVPEAWLIQQVEAAGFKLAGKSEINANPKDTKDYPKGVWTLPPTYAEGDKDKDKYTAIGESDRMTLKFVRPAKPAKSAVVGGVKAEKTPDASTKPITK